MLHNKFCVPVFFALLLSLAYNSYGEELITVFSYQSHGFLTTTKSEKNQGGNNAVIVQYVTQDNTTGNNLSSRNAMGDEIIYSYDSFGRKRRVNFVSTQKQQETFDYPFSNTQHCNVTHYPNQRSKTICYDALSREVSRYDSALGNKPLERETYNDQGLLIKRVMANNLVHTYTYDTQQRQLTQKDSMLGQPVQLTKVQQYDDVANSTVSFLQGLEGVQSAHLHEKYDDAHHLTNREITAVTTAANTIPNVMEQVNVSNDNFGNRVTTTASRVGSQEKTTHYTYNSLGAMKTATIMAGAEREGITPDRLMRTSFSYDALNNKLQRKTFTRLNQQGNPDARYQPVTRYQKHYTPAGKLADETLLGDGIPLVKHYHYDAGDNIGAVTDWHLNGGQSTTFHYQYQSILGIQKRTAVNVPAHTDQDGHVYPAYTRVTNYDATTGNVTQTYRQLSNDVHHYDAIHYDYDNKSGLLTQKTYLDTNKSLHYTYDAESKNLIAITNPLGYMTRFSYGDANNPALLTNFLRSVTLYKPDGKTKLIRIVYQPDALENIANKYRYQYDAQGKAQLVDVYHYTYDQQGRPIAVSHKENNAIGSDIETMYYTFAKNGELTHETYHVGDGDNLYLTDWYYNNLDRLVGVKKTQYTASDETIVTTQYEVSPNANVRVKKVSTQHLGKQGIFQEIAKQTGFSYDGFDQITKMSNQTSNIRYNKTNGDLLQDESNYRYDYDASHKLRHLYQGNQSIAAYHYGSDGLRRSKQGVDRQGKPISLHYYYNGNQLLATDSDQADGQGHAFYLIDGEREARLVIEPGQTTPSISFYGTDRQSISSQLLLEKQGNKRVNYHQYQTYGQPLASQSKGHRLSLAHDPYGSFTQYSEQESDGRLQYRPARELLTSFRQFTTLDTDSRFSNRYGYAEANPVMKVDPSGNNTAVQTGLNIVMYGISILLPFRTKINSRFIQNRSDVLRFANGEENISDYDGRISFPLLGRQGCAIESEFLRSPIIGLLSLVVLNIPKLWDACRSSSRGQADAVLQLVATGASAGFGLLAAEASLGLSALYRDKWAACASDGFQALQHIFIAAAAAVPGAYAARAAEKAVLFNPAFDKLNGMYDIKTTPGKVKAYLKESLKVGAATAGILSVELFPTRYAWKDRFFGCLGAMRNCFGGRGIAGGGLAQPIINVEE